MADVSRLPPDLQKLFQPPLPVKYVQPNDIPPEKRATPKISGIAQYLPQFKEAEADNYVGTQNWLQEVRMQKRLKAIEHSKKLREEISKWDPSHDPQVRGDPYKTLFISRLHYDLVEKDLEEVFSKFGPLERIRLVRDENGKSRGYAFVVFERERDMKAAHRESYGLKLKGRRVVIDVERGRTVKGWKPRRLGGGRGGRNYTKEELLRRKEVNKRDDRRVGGSGYRRDDRSIPPPARERFDDRRKDYGRKDYRDRERERSDWRDSPREKEREQRDRERERDRDRSRPYDYAPEVRRYRERSPPRRY